MGIYEMNLVQALEVVVSTVKDDPKKTSTHSDRIYSITNQVRSTVERIVSYTDKVLFVTDYDSFTVPGTQNNLIFV